MKLQAMIGLAVGLVLTAVVWAVPRAQADNDAPLRLSGTYLQLNASHLEWSDAEWAELFEHFRALGLSQVIVQWSAYEHSHFYPHAGAMVGRRSPVEHVLDLADRMGMQVRLGLAFEENYWTEIAKKPEEVGPYLQKLAQRSASIAQELFSLAQHHPSFVGWYIPQEVDDGSWRERDRRELLYGFVQQLSWSLHELAPRVPVAVSGFSNGAMDPVAFQAFWEGLLGRAPQIDTVLFQDGIGAHKLDFFELPLYTTAMRKAADATSRQVVAIVELFHQVSGPPVDEKVFRAVPASLPRIIRQLEIAHRYAPMAVAFSVPEYLSPKGGDAARILYDEYRYACVAKRCAAQERGKP